MINSDPWESQSTDAEPNLEMAHALYHIFMESMEPEIVRAAAAPLFNTEWGQLYMKQNRVNL